MTSAKKDNTHLIVVTLDCGSDFLFHKSLYEKHFETYENRILLKKGKVQIDKYHIYVEKELHYLLPKKSWNDTLLLYKINNKETRLDIYLLIGEQEHFLETYKIIEIEQQKIKLSWWDKIVKFLKEIF